MSIRQNYNHTLYACYTGYITQAIVNNFAPLLFLTFQGEFGLTLDMVALLVAVNFGTQLVVDYLSARVVDRIGYRPCIIAAHLFSALGLIGLAVLPGLVPGAYAGLIAAVILYAIGGGIIEVLISPIVEACPTERKEAAMSLLHSFYCWGHLFVVVASTVFFQLAGIGSWRVMACIWAIVPALNAVYFTHVPINTLAAEDSKGMTLGQLARNGMFWVLMLLMMCSGAAEQAMSQWASAFAEAGLNVSKTMGDLLGPCMFAITMGSARVIYSRVADRLPVAPAMTICGALCIVSYLLAGLSANPAMGLIGCALCGFSVGVMWPGSFSTGVKALPAGGTALFALMALAGDLGCSSGPTLVGLVSGAANDNLRAGFLAALVFPVLLIVAVNLVQRRMSRS
ncbi:MAG TPA: MFS transporter [Candidatus Fimadaptatus faecigallinarum]|uniref:MFS transporter n=1 Tax=Candidatus Fimadaptatus faecigallinarum TaxID=2840814 RepID=A0A9D1S3T3_9FIRM|nr:MFS transporter [Candidatus Fimadaptatus faecigallinarum]